jgi:endonuclease/exonuclease/phosphatase family metal-dependent hydrolase
MDFNRKTINDAPAKPRFSVLTYNVWFDKKYQVERTNKIIKLVPIYEPDIICLQELTETSYKLFENALSETYHIFQVFTTVADPYGTGLAFKRETVSLVDKPYYFDYNNTKMGRRIIGCEAQIAGIKIHFLTTHLESMSKNAHLRSLQFDTIKTAISNLDNIIIAGDFNITEKNEEIEKKLAISKLEDCWIKIGCPVRIAWTYNSKKNKNITVNNKKNVRSRLDRIYYSNGSREFRVARMQLIGMSDVSEDIPFPPSDHFGLLTNFIIKDQE